MNFDDVTAKPTYLSMGYPVVSICKFQPKTRIQMSGVLRVDVYVIKNVIPLPLKRDGHVNIYNSHIQYSHQFK